MYASIVSRNIHASWRHLDQHNYTPVLRQFAPRFRHIFIGQHALAGERHSTATLERFFQRLFRLFPDMRFQVREVFVKGMPWNTTAIALVDIKAHLAGEVYQNEIAQTIRLRWGKIIEIRVLEDTQKLAAALDALSAAGVSEARAAPIEDVEQTERF